MFIVTFDDKTTLVEGQDPEDGGIASWNDIPVNKKIIGVTLSDGGRLAYPLYGYDWYVCCYRAIQKKTMVVRSGGYMSPLDALDANKTVGQQLFGIRDWGPHVQYINKLVYEARHELAELFPKGKDIKGNRILINGHINLVSGMKAKYKALLKHLRQSEVTMVELGFMVRQMPRNEMGQLEAALRSGFSLPPSDATDRDYILKALILGMPDIEEVTKNG